MDDGVAPSTILREVARPAAVTPMPSPGLRRPIVIVLGMHRSGTSICSHVLSALGVDMTDKVAGPGQESPGPDNPAGHWERWEIVNFHDRILEAYNQGFFSPFHDFALPVAWWADPQVVAVRREIAGFLENRMGAGYFGFKDPRTVRLLPMWWQILNELKLAPKILYCLRNPAQVARSLHRRDGFSIEAGEYRWLCYNVDFFRYTKSTDFCTIEYESWFDDPSVNLNKLRSFLDLPEIESPDDMEATISQLIDDQLRHDDSQFGDARQPIVRSVYKLARNAGHDGAAHEHLQRIASQFLTFQQLQKTLQKEFAETVAAASKLPALQNEAADFRNLLQGQTAECAALKASLAEIGRAHV